MTLAQRLALLKGNTQSASTPHTTMDGVPAEEKLPVSLRLERLGRSNRIIPRAKRSDSEVAARLCGEVITPGLIRIEQTLPLDSYHGNVAFSALAGVSFAALGLHDDTSAHGLLFLDTETTGLAGGTGTLPFMVCLARVEGDQLRLRQWVLTGFAAEPSLLECALEWIEPSAHLVSYNGKSFDVPLLVTRYRLARHPDPFAGKGHVDLLHLTRRAYGHGWGNCRLQTAEQRLLGLIRDNDFPSHAIPQAWADFVRGGKAEPLGAIAEHNQRDVLSLAALLGVLVRVYAEPGHEAVNPLKIAQVHACRGELQHAIDHLTGARSKLDDAALLALARLHWKQQQNDRAVAIWAQLKDRSCAAATEALAKYHEHVTRDWEAARLLTEELVRLEPMREAHSKRWARLHKRVNKK